MNSEYLLHEILHEVRQIRAILHPRAVSATLHLNSENTMPLSVAIGGKFTAAPPAFLEWDQPNGQGNQIAPVGPLTYASDNPAVGSVDANGNGLGVAVGTCNITTTDTGNGLSATDVLTVIDKAVSATLNLQAA